LELTAVSNIMVRKVTTATQNQDIKSIAAIMIENKIGSVVIVTDMRVPVGIITERDIVWFASQPSSLYLNIPAMKVMSTPIITLDSNSSVKEALELMRTKNIRRIPIVDGSRKMVGIITDKDIFNIILKDSCLVDAQLTDKIFVEYRPLYERFNDFMHGQFLEHHSR
jgi:CBS domain-containing protein